MVVISERKIRELRRGTLEIRGIPSVAAVVLFLVFNRLWAQTHPGKTLEAIRPRCGTCIGQETMRRSTSEKVPGDDEVGEC